MMDFKSPHPYPSSGDTEMETVLCDKNIYIFYNWKHDNSNPDF